MSPLKSFFLNTTGEIDVLSIIHEVNRAINEDKVVDGMVVITAPDPGAAITVVEPLPEILAQLKGVMQLFPGAKSETKNRRKEEVPIGPRVAAAIIGKSLSLPIRKGKLALGVREEPVLIDFERTARRREFLVYVMGAVPAENKSQGQELGQMDY